MVVEAEVQSLSFLCLSTGDGQWKYNRQENAHTVSVLTPTNSTCDQILNRSVSASVVSN